LKDVVVGEDGVPRCGWGASPPEYRAYHDLEWGRPVADNRRVFEKLCLEGFQSGLSWLTILRKREAFRAAFAQFDPELGAVFDDADVARLLADAGIVRHRGKILAAIANAQSTVRLRHRGGSLAALLWKYEPEARGETTDVPASIAESKALSAELRKMGLQYVGPTTAYAAMQALGVVNDHLPGCRFREVAFAERAAFQVPR
jgi:DNA-3-methyladenine glycosylase I